jgi:uncharacterized membrane protein YccF (DUF307 family)
MRLLLNLLWFILGGWISGTLWIVAGVILAATIIGLPWAPAVFRVASLAYWPFGRTVVERPGGAAGLLLNVIWLIVAGWWLALHHVALAVALALTIIGIPFAWQHLKMALLSLAPVGKSIVDT